MIGISGRCASGARAPPAASTPSPSTPAHVEGARFAFKRKTGCYVVAEPRALGGPFHYAMGVFNPCLATDGMEGARRRRSEPPAPRRTPRSSSAVFAPGSGPRRGTRRSKLRPPRASGCDGRACENVRDGDEAEQRREEAKGEGGERPHTVAPDIWTIRAFPRSTRICAIVLGSVTTSSFFSRYVVSIPAKGGRSSST